MTFNTRTGIIVAVCTNPIQGVQKFPRDEVEVGTHGLVGDYHNKPMRQSFSKPGTEKPNIDRHITIVAQEVIDDMNRALGLTLGPGSMGENITTCGLGDLANVPDGSIVEIGTVYLHVIEQNQPCHLLSQYHKLLPKQIYGRRGLLCAILENMGVGVKLSPKTSIRVHNR